MRSIPVLRSLSLASLAGGGAALWLGCAGAAPPEASDATDRHAGGMHAEAPASTADAEGGATDPEVDVRVSSSAASGSPGDVAAPAPERGVIAPEVALARFTTAVEDREPVDAVSFLPNVEREVLFYTDLRGLEGRTVLHRWEYRGEVVAEVRFDVHSPRWRVWSSKALQPEWVGDWTASVIGPDGEVLAVETFTYQKAR